MGIGYCVLEYQLDDLDDDKLSIYEEKNKPDIYCVKPLKKYGMDKENFILEIDKTNGAIKTDLPIVIDESLALRIGYLVLKSHLQIDDFDEYRLTIYEIAMHPNVYFIAFKRKRNVAGGDFYAAIDKTNCSILKIGLGE